MHVFFVLCFIGKISLGWQTFLGFLQFFSQLVHKCNLLFFLCNPFCFLEISCQNRFTCNKFSLSQPKYEDLNMRSHENVGSYGRRYEFLVQFSIHFRHNVPLAGFQQTAGINWRIIKAVFFLHVVWILYGNQQRQLT